MLEAVLASGEIVNELIFPPIFFALIAWAPSGLSRLWSTAIAMSLTATATRRWASQNRPTT